MNEKEKRIKEQRSIEAIKKNMMGAGGKLGIVVKYLGQPIIEHSRDGGVFHSKRYLPDPYELPNENNDEWGLQPGTSEEIQSQLPYMDMPSVLGEPEGGSWRNERNYTRTPVGIRNVGWHFDGLNHGMHLEIWYREDRKELTAYYKGYIVYKEVTSELETYTPFDEWEDKIDSLYTVARRKDQKTTKQEKATRREKAQKNKENWLQRMRKKWGI